MDELELFEFLENDADSTSSRKKQRCLLRAQIDPFTLEDDEFVRQYRLSKSLVSDLCDELRPMFHEPKRMTDLSVETKVLTALSFYATGSYQKSISGIVGHSMAQQTVSSVITQVTTFLDSPQMHRKYIAFPETAKERSLIRKGFYQRFGVPGVLGCIDCTHIAIVRPIENEDWYRCRIHNHSLNVQLICDSNMQILSVDASHGGRSHDSFIFNNHPIKEHLENLNENTWLLGDSEYPSRKYLMTPIVDALRETPEAYYTSKHVITHNIIERTIGLLKARFRCLSSHRVLHYSPGMAASIINACVILHNICNSNGVDLPGVDIPQEELIQKPALVQVPESSVNNQAPRLGQSTRRTLVDCLWRIRDD